VVPAVWEPEYKGIRGDLNGRGAPGKRRWEGVRADARPTTDKRVGGRQDWLTQVKVRGISQGLNSTLPQTGATTVRKGTVPEQLRGIPLFKALPADQLDRLAGAATRRTSRSREVVYEQGDPASSCFVVLGGTLRFRVRLGKQTATSGLAYANDVFGLESLQSNAKRQETAIAGGVAELLEIRNEFFREFVLENPGFQFELLNYVVAKYHEKSFHAVHTGHYDAEQRLAAYLIDSCSGRPLRGCRQSAPMSQADLADYLALTPETLCRKVSKFRKLGWIGGRGNEYVIKKPAALQGLLDQ